ncbi:MAG TPA: TetR/AcrR family transcriptional regulator [Pseudonocardiaceae bacterium]|nr:TetR/AcrR family transcriptional regulator [Pseudonocardiaceae bacterium]
MKPMPATAKGRRSRIAIVEAAAGLMHDQGIAGTPIDDVLTASGTGKSQLYHYFDGKQDLTVAVLYHQLDRVLDSQPSLRDPDCTDLRRWRDEVLHAHHRNHFGNCPLGVFAGQVGDDPVLRQELAGLFDQWQQAIAGLVTRAVAAGRVHPDTDPVSTALALLTALQGGTMLGCLRGSEHPLAEAIDRVLSTIS